MSFVDIATITLHRRHEMEDRINTLANKCDFAMSNLDKIKTQSRELLNKLNCPPSELKDQFLGCMKQLDEYIYLVTDFNICVSKLDIPEGRTKPYNDAPVQETLVRPTPPVQMYNLIDVLSEPSTSKVYSYDNTLEKPKKDLVPKKDLLIAFSSTSTSAESVPQSKNRNKDVGKQEKEIQCEIIDAVGGLTVNDTCRASIQLPAQSVLQTDVLYDATIMHIDGASFWIITDDIDTVYNLMTTMTSHYKENPSPVTVSEAETMTYCACYDDDSDCYYRALFIRILERSPEPTAEVFLVDTGEVTTAAIASVHALLPRFCAMPPYARCCHLAEVDLLGDDPERMLRQEKFMKQYAGVPCVIEVDDNSSESLGVWVTLPSKEVVNDLIVQEGLAVTIDKPEPAPQKRDTQKTELVKTETRQRNEVTHKAEIHKQPENQKQQHRRSIDNKRGKKQGVSEARQASPDIIQDRSENTQSRQRSHENKGIKNTRQGPPEIRDISLDIDNCPEYEDPVEAVTGYSCRDDIDICKHYKDESNKMCFKGLRCKKRHVLKHPDGWTLDRVSVCAKLRTPPLPAPGTWCRVTVVYIALFDQFFIHLLDDNTPEKHSSDFGVILPPMTLDSLVRDMNSPATINAYKKLTMVPAPGQLVAAIYPPDGLWYRARVLTIDKHDQSVEVNYVDYGNILDVKEDALRELDVRHAALPAQAVRCVLAGATGRRGDLQASAAERWAQAKAELSQMVLNKNLDAYVIARGYDDLTVELYDEDKYNVAEILAAGNFIELKEYSVEDSSIRQKLVVP